MSSLELLLSRPKKHIALKLIVLAVHMSEISEIAAIYVLLYTLLPKSCHKSLYKGLGISLRLGLRWKKLFEVVFFHNPCSLSTWWFVICLFVGWKPFRSAQTIAGLWDIG